MHTGRQGWLPVWLVAINDMIMAGALVGRSGLLLWLVAMTSAAIAGKLVGRAVLWSG